MTAITTIAARHDAATWVYRPHQVHQQYMVHCMSFLHDQQYAKTATFTKEQILAITPNHICRWLTYRAYGKDEINENDRRSWVEDLAMTSFGDVDLDGQVNFGDFIVLAEKFGEPGGWASGDFDGDAFVGFSDFVLLIENFGASAAAVPSSSNEALANGRPVRSATMV